MQIIMLLMVIVIAVFFSIQLLSLVTIFKSNQFEFPTDYAYPKVSLLLAARNEALLIERCLAAIDQLDYPKDKLEILIGDDDSSDDTAALVQAFIKDKPQYRLISITTQVGKAKVKQMF